MKVLSTRAGDQATVKLSHLDELKDSRPIVIEEAGNTVPIQVLELDQVNDHEDEAAEEEHELEDLEVDEVFGHELARACGCEEADNCHDSCLHGQRVDDPHEVSWHQVCGQLRHVLYIFVHLSRCIRQVTVVEGQDNAANHNEEAATSALHLLVGPLDTFLSEAEEIAKDRHHHEELHDGETDQDSLS